MSFSFYEIANVLGKTAELCPSWKNISVQTISTDSRAIGPNCVFFAIQGDLVDGRKFIPEAINNGAIAVIMDEGKDHAFPQIDTHIPIFSLPHVRASLGKVCALMYPNCSRTLIGVTGTDGKTSTTDCLRQLWEYAGIAGASIGTIGVKVVPQDLWDAPFSYPLTTPEHVMLHDILHQCALHGINHVALEATSHGLHQGRFGERRFSIGIFTHFSRDHLDYHKTIENYWDAKKLLFEKYVREGGIALIHSGLDRRDELLAICRDRHIKAFLYGPSKDGSLPFSYRIERYAMTGQVVRFSCLGREWTSFVPYIGTFQIDNLTAALGAFALLGHNLDTVIPHLEKMRPIPGRAEWMGNLISGGDVFVDYAHTPGALETVLRHLRLHTAGKIGLVFGCGGGRDTSKRKMMGEIASALADWAIITDDNPRTEQPEAIRAQIREGCPKADELSDRRGAIFWGIQRLGPGDVLLITGKGHEAYQIIGTERFFFCDRECAKEILAQKNAELAGKGLCLCVPSQEIS